MLITEILHDSPSWMAFFGRFHPLIVHLPIGFLISIILLEFLKLYDKISFSNTISKLFLALASITAIFSCLFGYLLSLEGGYEEELLEEHKLQGIILAIFTTLAWIIKIDFFSKRLSKYNVIYFPVLILNFFLLILTGHHGGNLTHGETYLFDKLPIGKDPISNEMLGVSQKHSFKSLEEINNSNVYQSFIQPILSEKCEKCHSASKIKGKLRLDNFEMIMRGGEHKNTIVPNECEKSELIKRILLPENHDDHMPPIGKPQISENELLLLKWWIDNGAKANMQVKAMTKDSVISKILNSMIIVSGSSQSNIFSIENEIFETKIEEINEKQITELKNKGFFVNKLSQNNNYVEVVSANKSLLNLKGLTDIAENIVWLKLSRNSINLTDSEGFDNLKNLTRLNLENSSISDDSFSKIQFVPNLEYLNLVNTNISDVSIKHLIGFKNLKKLYLWNTKISPKGIELLKKSLPNLIIDSGISLEEISKLNSLKPDSISDDVYSSKKK